jgi:hypothetical protein
VRQGLFIFNQLSKMFPHVLFSFIEGASPGSCEPIDAAQAFSGSLFAGMQIATLFEAMKNRVHRPGTDPVSMAGQLFAHARAKNKLPFCVMQNEWRPTKWPRTALLSVGSVDVPA